MELDSNIEKKVPTQLSDKVTTFGRDGTVSPAPFTENNFKRPCAAGIVFEDSRSSLSPFTENFSKEQSMKERIGQRFFAQQRVRMKLWPKRRLCLQKEQAPKAESSHPEGCVREISDLLNLHVRK